MKVIIDLTNGVMDGKTLTAIDSGDNASLENATPDEMVAIAAYRDTHCGAVGERFQISQNFDNLDPKYPFYHPVVVHQSQEHEVTTDYVNLTAYGYEIVERLEADNEILIRAVAIDSGTPLRILHGKATPKKPR